MSWIDASCVEDAWPLMKRKPDDLDWIRISKSKSAVWELTDPMRSDGLFRRLVQEQMVNHLESSVIMAELGIEGLPKRLLDVCGIDKGSKSESNRYLSALQGLGPAMAVDSVRCNIIILLGFVGKMSDDFQNLLRDRDPRALLLLVFWYAKIYGVVWWLDQRAKLEGGAICKYLERYHADETVIVDLLSYPKSRLGLSC